MVYGGLPCVALERPHRGRSRLRARTLCHESRWTRLLVPAGDRADPSPGIRCRRGKGYSVPLAQPEFEPYACSILTSTRRRHPWAPVCARKCTMRSPARLDHQARPVQRHPQVIPKYFPDSIPDYLAICRSGAGSALLAGRPALHRPLSPLCKPERRIPPPPRQP